MHKCIQMLSAYIFFFSCSVGLCSRQRQWVEGQTGVSDVTAFQSVLIRLCNEQLTCHLEVPPLPLSKKESALNYHQSQLLDWCSCTITRSGVLAYV